MNSFSTITVLRTVEEIELHRHEWESLNEHPNSQIDYFQRVCALRRSVKGFSIIRNRNADGTVSFIIARREQVPFTVRLGYKTFTLGTINSLTVINGGCLGINSVETARSALSALYAEMKDSKLDAIHFSHLSNDLPIVSALKTEYSQTQVALDGPPQKHWTSNLPSTTDEFLSRLSKKHRSWAKRMERITAAQFPDGIRYAVYDSVDSLNTAMEQIEEVAKSTYQRQLGVGFKNDPENFERFALEAKQGRLRIFILYLNNSPAAFWIGTLYKGTFHSGFTGYKPEFRKLEIGTQIFTWMADYLIKSNVRKLDYGLGDAQYKQRFGDQCWDEFSLTLYSLRPSIVLRRFAKATIEAPQRLARHMLSRSDLVQKIKTAWRRKLVASSGTPDPAENETK